MTVYALDVGKCVMFIEVTDELIHEQREYDRNYMRGYRAGCFAVTSNIRRLWPSKIVAYECGYTDGMLKTVKRKLKEAGGDDARRTGDSG